jgi:hypothetical protein
VVVLAVEAPLVLVVRAVRAAALTTVVRLEVELLDKDITVVSDQLMRLIMAVAVAVVLVRLAQMVQVVPEAMEVMALHPTLQEHP